jgi:hypothetical protein
MRIASLLLLGLFVSTPGAAVSPPPSEDFTFAFEAGAGKASLRLRVVEPDGYVHAQAPLKVRLSGTGVTFPRSELGREDARVTGSKEKPAELLFDVPFTTTGNGEIVAKVEFYLCTPKVCLKKEGEARLPVPVR